MKDKWKENLSSQILTKNWEVAKRPAVWSRGEAVALRYRTFDYPSFTSSPSLSETVLGQSASRPGWQGLDPSPQAVIAVCLT